jgi:hypothetical protein
MSAIKQLQKTNPVAFGAIQSVLTKLQAKAFSYSEGVTILEADESICSHANLNWSNSDSKITVHVVLEPLPCLVAIWQWNGHQETVTCTLGETAADNREKARNLIGWIRFRQS